MLIAAGWVVQSKSRVDLSAGRGVVVRELQTDAGPAEYVLFVDRKPVGLIEAKREEEGERLTVHEDQSESYARAKLKYNLNQEPLPFVYESTGACSTVGEHCEFTRQFRNPPPMRTLGGYHGRQRRTGADCRGSGMSKKQTPQQISNTNRTNDVDFLIGDIRALIEETRSAVAVTVNAGLTILYWRIGVRVREDILGKERADYGDEIVVTLSRQLTMEYGRGFSEKSLRHMIRLTEAFPDERIVSALMRQSSAPEPGV